MSKRLYPGINIQWPISEMILSGQKTIETRTYSIPEHYLNEEMIIIETPGKHGKFKARMRGIIVFTSCFQYPNPEAFYKDFKRHGVDKDSMWAWKDKPKWGWALKMIEVFEKPKPLNRQPGIVYSKDLKL